MKIIFIIGFILFAIIAYSMYDMYHLSCLFGEDCKYDDNHIKQNQVITQNSDQIQPSIKLNSAQLYKENQCVQNNGFVNELMFKYNTYTDDLKQTSNTITKDVPSVPLNPPNCQLSSDLPIANINVRYMLQKNTTMLRDI